MVRLIKKNKTLEEWERQEMGMIFSKNPNFTAQKKKT